MSIEAKARGFKGQNFEKFVDPEYFNEIELKRLGINKWDFKNETYDAFGGREPAMT